MVEFKKGTLHSCRECPSCRIIPDPDPDDLFNYDDEKALCKESGNRVIEIMLRPYEKVIIPDWCPLKLTKTLRG